MNESCGGADGLVCIGGWLYSSKNKTTLTDIPMGMMIFPANRECPNCNKIEEEEDE